MYKTHHERITRNYHRLRRTEDEEKAFICTVGKENTSPTTKIRK
jgi:hypothetical protein